MKIIIIQIALNFYWLGIIVNCCFLGCPFIPAIKKV